MVVFYGDMKSPARVDGPVPVRFASKGNADAAPDLILYLDDYMLEQMRDFRRLCFTPKRVSFVVFAMLGRYPRQKLEKYAWQMGTFSGIKRLCLRDFYDKSGMAAVMEGNLSNFHGYSC